MSIEITMPKLGFDMQEGTLIGWLKKIGDPVKAGEPIAEIETDKAAVEIEFFQSGVLTDIIAEPGQSVKVGAVIGLLGDPGENVKKTAASPSFTMQSPSIEIDRAAQKVFKDLEKPRKTDRIDIEAQINISPLARRIARARGIDVRSIVGTGSGGMIVKRDIFSVENPPQTVPAVRQSSPETMPASQSEDRRIPLSQIRRIIAQRMTQSHTEVPQFSVSISIEMDRALEMRSRYNLIHVEQLLLINDLILRGVALSLRKFPRLNSSYHEQELEEHVHVNIGIAVALEDGLMTVVLRDADQKSLTQIAIETRIVNPTCS